MTSSVSSIARFFPSSCLVLCHKISIGAPNKLVPKFSNCHKILRLSGDTITILCIFQTNESLIALPTTIKPYKEHRRILIWVLSSSKIHNLFISDAMWCVVYTITSCILMSFGMANKSTNRYLQFKHIFFSISFPIKIHLFKIKFF